MCGKDAVAVSDDGAVWFQTEGSAVSAVLAGHRYVAVRGESKAVCAVWDSQAGMLAQLVYRVPPSMRR